MGTKKRENQERVETKKGNKNREPKSRNQRRVFKYRGTKRGKPRRGIFEWERRNGRTKKEWKPRRGNQA